MGTNQTKRVIVLQGVSGSGKSTYASHMVCDAYAKGSREEALRFSRHAIVSADDFFVRLGGGTYKFDPSRLSEAHGECFRVFLSALLKNEDLVIVDNTNTTGVEISPYMLAASAYGYECEVHRIECDPEVAAARNVHGAPASAVLAMADRIAKERLPPWWRVVRVRIDESGAYDLRAEDNQ